MSPSSLELEVGAVGSLQATVSGNEDLSRDDMGVTYQSSNTDVATVSRDGVTAFAEGTAIITATSDFDPSYFDTTRVTTSLGSSNQNQTDGVLVFGLKVTKVDRLTSLLPVLVALNKPSVPQPARPLLCLLVHTRCLPKAKSLSTPAFHTL